MVNSRAEDFKIFEKCMSENLLVPIDPLKAMSPKVSAGASAQDTGNCQTGVEMREQPTLRGRFHGPKPSNS